MKCSHCEYEGYVNKKGVFVKWISKSKHRFVSCPSCLHKVRNLDLILDSEKLFLEQYSLNPNIVSMAVKELGQERVDYLIKMLEVNENELNSA